jgi:hypothetical protein
MLTKLIRIVKPYLSIALEWSRRNRPDIILTIGAVLISLLSFSIGYIIAKTYDKEPIEIKEVLGLPDINEMC